MESHKTRLYMENTANSEGYGMTRVAIQWCKNRQSIFANIGTLVYFYICILV